MNILSNNLFLLNLGIINRSPTKFEIIKNIVFSQFLTSDFVHINNIAISKESRKPLSKNSIYKIKTDWKI